VIRSIPECYETMIHLYPHVVALTGYGLFDNVELHNWFTDAGKECIVMSNVTEGPGQPRTLTFGFKSESDAIVFKLKFGNGTTA